MKKILKAIGGFFQRLFSDQWGIFRKYSAASVAVVEAVKKLVSSPITGLVVDLTPTDIDDKLLSKLKLILPEVAERMAMIYQITLTGNNSEAWAIIIAYVKSKNKEARADFWIRLAAELNLAFADGKMTMPEAIILTQMVYNEIKGPSEPTP